MTARTYSCYQGLKHTFKKTNAFAFQNLFVFKKSAFTFIKKKNKELTTTNNFLKFNFNKNLLCRRVFIYCMSSTYIS